MGFRETSTVYNQSYSYLKNKKYVKKGASTKYPELNLR